MKRTFFALIYVMILSSCSEEDKEFNRFEFSLYQTFWKGTLTYKDSGNTYDFEIKIVFESENIGEYLIEDFVPQLPYSSKSIFRFKKENRKITIDEGYNNILTGNWWIIDYQGDKMVLRKDVIDDSHNSELCLTKIL